MKNILIIALVFILSSCGSLKNKNAVTYWVNSYKTECTGVAPMHCMLIQKGDRIQEDSWQNFYSNIEGFEYQPGYIYKLKVKEEQLDPSNVPADASSIKYTLLKMEEKKQDQTLRLNDIWLLTSIKGAPINPQELKRPNSVPILEIHIAKHRILGTDGCNQYGGQLIKLNQTEIEFGAMMGTKKMCSDIEISDAFNQAMSIVKAYKLDGMELTLFDAESNELLTFKKID